MSHHDNVVAGSDIVILSAARTPIGKFQGALSGIRRAAVGRGRDQGGDRARRDRFSPVGRSDHGQRRAGRRGAGAGACRRPSPPACPPPSAR